MRKFPKLRYPEDSEAEDTFKEGEIYIQEKLDGGNGRFMLEEHLDEEYQTDERELVFGSRNVVYKNDKDVSNQFEPCVEYVRENVYPYKIRRIEERHGPLVFFGEYMVPHTIQGYDWENIPKFVGFDVWKEETEEWLSPRKARSIFTTIGLETAPILDVVTVEEFSNGDTKLHDEDGEFEVPMSDYGDVKAEGVVFKNPKTQTYAKYVRDSFKEKNNKTFNSKPDREDPGHVKLSHAYITNARIEKMIHKLTNEEGWDYEMEMMEDLPTRVIEDMVEEEGVEIFMGENYTVDLSEFRSHVSQRCARILRQTINERIQQGL